MIEFIEKATKQGKNYVKKVNVKRLNFQCEDCLRQQNNALGFLPITNLDRVRFATSLKPNIVLTQAEFNPIAVHNQVRATGKYNFQEAKIQLPSDINFEKLEEWAQGYWDWQLPYLLKYGFPLDFPTEKENCLKHNKYAHSSALKHPEHVEMYIKDEMQHKAVYGPFKQPPYGSATHISPFITREKTDGDKRRVIIGLKSIQLTILVQPTYIWKLYLSYNIPLLAPSLIL